MQNNVNGDNKKKTTVKNFMLHVFIFAHSANFTLKTFVNDLLLMVKNKRKKIEISWILIMCLLLMARQYEKIPYILDFFFQCHTIWHIG